MQISEPEQGEDEKAGENENPIDQSSSAARCMKMAATE